MFSSPSLRYAYSTDRIEVTVLDSGILYMNWKGPQDLQSIRQEGTRLLDIQREAAFNKAINNNIAVIGSWDQALPYVMTEWFPAMKAYGLLYLAWVLPQDEAALASVMQVTTTSVAISTFPNHVAACTWLYSQPDTLNP